MESIKAVEYPNILFILSDDQGPWAMGCAGNNEMITPNLDQLAAEGMRFNSFFCTSPVCSPARASLLTGRIPSQHGVHDWIAEGNAGERPTEYLQGMTGYTELLAEAGYECALSGKWHLGDSKMPQKGFDHWYVHQTGGGPYYGAPMIRNGKLETEERYVTDVITDEAIAFLKKRERGKPFYLGVHYTAPHHPWIDCHPEEYMKLYEDCEFLSCPQEEPHADIIDYKVDSGNPRASLQGYFAAVTAMDAAIGRILEQLDAAGDRDNTLICFLSDNGFNCGHHGIWGKGNGTFPLNMYDTSVKVPAIFSHPGAIPESVVCDELVSGYDFMPTLLDYLNLSNPEGETLPGRSFAHLLRGEGSDGDEHVVIFDEYGPVRMIREKEWKYVHRYPYGPHELYDMMKDPDERWNLIHEESYRGEADRLRGKLDAWFHQYVDPGIDGAREPVTGGGQIDLAGIRSGGRKSYNE